MQAPCKVFLWGEGSFLRPQYCHQQDRYRDVRLAATAAAKHPYCWGVRRLDLHRREPARRGVASRGGGLASFWLLHTAASGQAALAHHLAHPDLHPECQFQQLPALAGGLLRSSRTVKLEDLPACLHQDPGPASARLDAILRDRLDAGKIDGGTALSVGVAPGLPAPQLSELVPLWPHMYYVVLDNLGMPYDGMLKAQAISIDVPTGIRDLQLEPIAIAA